MTRHANCAEHSRTHRTWCAPHLALIAVSVALCNPAFALDPNRRISQYGHTSWRVQDGYFAGAPQAMTQTTDGYLWIGTASGLVRFDGVRFVSWVFPQGETLPSSSIYALAGARDGSLWVGTATGLSHWKGGHLVNYRENRGRINAIREDEEGAIWFVRSRAQDDAGPFCRVQGEGTRCYGKADGIPFPWAVTLASDRHGGFWIGSTGGVCHWTTKAVRNYSPEYLRDASGTIGVTGFGLIGDGTPLIGLGQAGPGFGLQTIIGDTWRDYPLPKTVGSTLAVSTLLIDRDSGIWVSAIDGGLHHVHGGRADRFRRSDGLSSDTIMDFYEDREANVWTISQDGIDRFRDLPVGTISRSEGLTPHLIGSVSATRNGKVWIGGGDSISLINGDALSTIGATSGLTAKMVTSVVEGRSGRLWVGSDAGLLILENGKFRSLKTASDGSRLTMVSGLAEDNDQNIWALVIGRPQRLLRIRAFSIVEEFLLTDPVMGGALVADPTGGIWVGHVSGKLTRYRPGQEDTVKAADGSGPVRHVMVDSDGSTWASTEKGLVRRKDGKQQTIDRRSGLPCDDVLSAVRDDLGGVWLYAVCGLMRISSADLDHWWQSQGNKLSVKLFDAFDGAHPATVPFGPVVAKSSDGRLWFSNETAIQFVDPRNLSQNTLPPPVRIEQIVADRIVHVPTQNLRLPALTRDLQIDYTALSIAVPQKVRFRYLLEGRGEGWQDAGTRRQAFYTDLSPGDYRFRVIASNNDGVGNQAGEALTFSIAPAYYQTAWFYAIWGVCGLLFLWAVYQFRVRQLAAAMSLRFDERMAERNRLSGELHDTILQSVQISKMVAEHALTDKSNDSPENMRKALVTLSGWLAQATTDGRAALNALRTSTAPKRDLVEAFEQAAEISQVTGAVDFIVSVEGTAREMHPIVQDEIYRIGCEAIRNASLHSHASQIEVKVIFAQNLTVRVKDNGKGMDPTLVIAGRPGHFGLAGMQERATRIGGLFHVVSRPGAGTEIELGVPGKIAYAGSGGGTILAKLRAISLRMEKQK